MTVEVDCTTAAWVFAAVPESVAAARQMLVGWFDGADVPATRVADAELVLSELVTNVVRHGGGDIICQLSMCVGDRCCIAVVDAGDALPRLVERRPDQVTGLGLHIVERLSIDWGVSDFPCGKAVWAVVPIGTHGLKSHEQAAAR